MPESLNGVRASLFLVCPRPLGVVRKLFLPERDRQEEMIKVGEGHP